MAKKGKRIAATNGGVILFGLPEIRETYFPYAEVRCARFKETSPSEFIDRLKIEGGILAAIELGGLIIKSAIDTHNKVLILGALTHALKLMEQDNYFITNPLSPAW